MLFPLSLILFRNFVFFFFLFLLLFSPSCSLHIFHLTITHFLSLFFSLTSALFYSFVLSFCVYHIEHMVCLRWICQKQGFHVLRIEREYTGVRIGAQNQMAEIEQATSQKNGEKKRHQQQTLFHREKNFVYSSFVPSNAIGLVCLLHSLTLCQRVCTLDDALHDGDHEICHFRIFRGKYTQASYCLSMVFFFVGFRSFVLFCFINGCSMCCAGFSRFVLSSMQPI